jgi:hypothetical protein
VAERTARVFHGQQPPSVLSGNTISATAHTRYDWMDLHVTTTVMGLFGVASAVGPTASLPCAACEVLMGGGGGEARPDKAGSCPV